LRIVAQEDGFQIGGVNPAQALRGVDSVDPNLGL
jgi:hypothetical protein